MTLFAKIKDNQERVVFGGEKLSLILVEVSRQCLYSYLVNSWVCKFGAQ